MCEFFHGLVCYALLFRHFEDVENEGFFVDKEIHAVFVLI